MKIFSSLLFVVLIIGNVGCQIRSSEQKRPNILFAISDDHSYAHTSYAGCDFINTPGFDRVASEGVFFENCYAGSPGCAPSRSSIVTGRHHWQNEQAGQHASSWLKKYVPFIDLIAQNGYEVGKTGKGVGPFKYNNKGQNDLWRSTDAAGPDFNQIRYTSENDVRPAKGIGKINYFENFKRFLQGAKKEKPFFFWFGGNEPHRVYEKGSWKRMGKKLKDVQVPAFLPDNDEIRGDLLDYAVEIEWFDLHLKRMLEHLEAIGELENTIVIVTADNGMPFPRAKANCYDYGVHVPFAVRYPKKFNKNRVVKDPIGFIDIAPTVLEITKTSSKGMMPITGTSLLDILESKKSGTVSKKQKVAFSGRERHSSSRYLNKGYPQRSIRQGEYLLIWNLKPERWPAGAPQKFDPKHPEVLLPMHGLDADNKFIRDAAYMDIDDCPTKTYLIENHENETIVPYFEMAHNKRPEYEMYNLDKDPSCIQNLAESAKHKAIQKQLIARLEAELQSSKDPRVVGPDYEVFDSYKRYSRMRYFPKPDHEK